MLYSHRLVPLPQNRSCPVLSLPCKWPQIWISFCSHYCKSRFWPFVLYPLSIYFSLSPLCWVTLMFFVFFLSPDIQVICLSPTGKLGISFYCQNLKAGPIYTDYWPSTSIPSSGAFKNFFPFFIRFLSCVGFGLKKCKRMKMIL